MILTCSLSFDLNSAMCASRFSSLLFIFASSASRVAVTNAAFSSSRLRDVSSILLSLAAIVAILLASMDNRRSSAALSFSAMVRFCDGLGWGGEGALLGTVGSARITS